jgi:methyl-accepting chemotaxis protein
MWLSKMSIKSKLIALCLLMSTVPIGVGVFAFLGLGSTTASFQKVTNIVLPNIQYSDTMFLNYQKVRISLRTLGLPGITANQAEKEIKAVEMAIANYEEAARKYQEVPFSDGEKELFDRVAKSWSSFKETGVEAIKSYRAGTPEGHARLIEIFFNDCPMKAGEYAQAIDKLVEYHRNHGQQWVGDAQAAVADTHKLILIVILAGVTAGLGAGMWFAFSLSKTISNVASELAGGATQVNQAAEQISSSSQTLSESTTQQASSLEETVATMEEMTAMVKLNSENAKQAAALSSSTREIAVRGEEEIQKLIGSIQSISADSKKIAEITSVIDDIAFQTNLLALNAAVEAARAGEQGKGFAVVADAVRSLAQRSAESAKNIAALIKESVEKIDVGSDQAGQSGVVLNEILSAVKKVSDLNNEISAASQEQSNGIAQIGKAMNQMDEVTQQNAAASEEAAAAAEELSAQSRSLQDNVKILTEMVGGESGRELHSPTLKAASVTQSPSRLQVIPGGATVKKTSPRSVTSSKSSAAIPFDEDGEGDSERKIGTAEGF